MCTKVVYAGIVSIVVGCFLMRASDSPKDSPTGEKKEKVKIEDLVATHGERGRSRQLLSADHKKSKTESRASSPNSHVPIHGGMAPKIVTTSATIHPLSEHITAVEAALIESKKNSSEQRALLMRLSDNHQDRLQNIEETMHTHGQQLSALHAELTEHIHTLPSAAKKGGEIDTKTVQEHASQIAKLNEYCTQFKETLDNRVLDIAKVEQEQVDYVKQVQTLEERVTILEKNQQEEAHDAIGVGLEEKNQEEQKATVAEALQNKHKELSDTVIHVVEQLTEQVADLNKEVAHLKEEKAAKVPKENDGDKKTVVAAPTSWHRTLLNIVTASSFFASGIYYSKAVLPFIAKAVTISGTTAATSVPYLYLPAAGLCACRIVADIYADYKKTILYDAYKQSWHDYFKSSSLWRNHPKPTSLFMGSAIICKALVNNCRAVGKTLSKMLITAGAINMLIAVGVGAAMIVPAAA